MRIVYFDGYCNLCNRFVDFLIRRDREGSLYFAPLQGGTAWARLDSVIVSDLATLALEDEYGISFESTAALRTLSHLGGVYRLALVFLVVPRVLRDLVYRQVAKRRYQWAGRRESCRLPTAEEKVRFLD